MTLFWHPTGPKLSYRNATLKVSDLNPHVETQWRMSRWEMVKLGFQCIHASLVRD